MLQGGQDWLEWRRQGLGSSDAPVVMGVSPWKTRFQLWEEKVGISAKGSGESYITRRGHELEPQARAQYEAENGFHDFPPALVQHAEYPHIRGSLDGWNQELRRVLEIKCIGADEHALAVAGKVPEKYWPQVQQQLLVTGFERCDYFSYHVTDYRKATEKREWATVIVEPDIDYCIRLLIELNTFWTLVQTGSPPELADRDYRCIRAAGFTKIARDYAALCDEIDELIAQKEALKEQMLTHEMTQGLARWRAANLRVTKHTRQGNIDYARVPQLSGVDLEPFRKKPSQVTTVRVVKGDVADEPEA